MELRLLKAFGEAHGLDLDVRAAILYVLLIRTGVEDRVETSWQVLDCLQARAWSFMHVSAVNCIVVLDYRTAAVDNALHPSGRCPSVHDIGLNTRLGIVGVGLLDVLETLHAARISCRLRLLLGDWDVTSASPAHALGDGAAEVRAVLFASLPG